MLTVVFGFATFAAWHLHNAWAVVFFGCLTLCMFAIEAGGSRNNNR